MDPNSPTPQAPQQVPPPPPSPYPRSKTIPMLVGAVFLLGVGLLGGYLFFSPKNTSEEKTTPTAQTSPSPIPTTMSVSPTGKANTLPTGWTYVSSQECNVSFPLPPKKEPYYIPAPTGATPDLMQDEGGYWGYDKNTSGGMFVEYAFVHFFNEDWGGSEYIPGLVQVGCSPNTKGYTTESLLSTYSDDYKNGKYAGPEGPLVFKSLGEKEMWGRQTIAYTISGGMGPDNGLNTHYLFATKEHIYTVSTMMMSQTPLVKNTTEQIFQNLQFNDK